jgi:hypothetical protein
MALAMDFVDFFNCRPVFGSSLYPFDGYLTFDPGRFYLFSSGFYTFFTGFYTFATGFYIFATGFYTFAMGFYTFAMGFYISQSLCPHFNNRNDPKPQKLKIPTHK